MFTGILGLLVVSADSRIIRTVTSLQLLWQLLWFKASLIAGQVANSQMNCAESPFS